MNDEISKTPELDNLLEYYLGEDGNVKHASAMTPSYRRFYLSDQIHAAKAALEARHAEEIKQLQSERDRAIDLMNMIDRGHPDVEEFNRDLREKAGKT